jgi:hypothetical protein
MWATFDLKTDAILMFAAARGADELRAVLGLDVNERGLPLLLMEYRLPVSIVARVPTIADAYSGQDWPYFFRPAPPESVHGWTLPWPSHEQEKPRPEVVHNVVTGRQIANPLRELK